QPGGLQRLARQSSENARCARRTLESGTHGELAAATEASQLGDRHRLARSAVLWSAAAQSQRTGVWQAAAWNDEVSYVCHGVHCVSWRTIYAGGNMGSPSRIESDGPQAVVGRNSQNRRENKVFAAGSRLL